jgi:hypothetical protein
MSKLKNLNQWLKNESNFDIIIVGGSRVLQRLIGENPKLKVAI